MAIVAEAWPSHKKPDLRSSTGSFYEEHTKNHFGKFENTKINGITTAKIDKYITDRQSTGMNILNVYAHLMKPVKQEAACRLENTIFETDGHKMVTKG